MTEKINNSNHGKGSQYPGSQEQGSPDDDSLYDDSNAESREVIRRALAAAAEEGPKDPGDCPSLDVIAQLVDKQLDAEEEDRVMEHLAQCEKCSEVYIMTSRMKTAADKREKESTGKSNLIMMMPRHRLALAASVIVAVVSLFIVYKVMWSPGGVKPFETTIDVDAKFGKYLFDTTTDTISGSKNLGDIRRFMAEHGHQLPEKDFKECRIQWPGAGSKSFFQPPGKIRVKWEKGVLVITVIK